MFESPSLVRAVAPVIEVLLRDPLAGQRLAVDVVATALRAHGLVVEVGDYAGAAAAEILGTDGRRVVVAPLFDWCPEGDGAENDRWEYAVRDVDGGLVARPDGDDAWGCPCIWEVSFAGFRLDQGVWSLEKVMVQAGEMLDWTPGREVLAAVGAAQPAADFPVEPYPGRRPTGSWVVDRAARCWPVRPDEDEPSGWAVQGPSGRVCLDQWLVDQGADRLAERVPVLSYGSNACPGKVVTNGTPLPSVNLACEMDGLASVWCAGATAAGSTPVTLTAVPGHREEAVVTMASVAELTRLDAIEGRRSNWYALYLLDCGRVVLENGARLPRPAAYVGARPERFPMLAQGEPVLRADVSHDGAGLLRRTIGAPHPEVPATLGERLDDGVHPSPGACVPRLFAYGTLKPGQSRWHLLNAANEGFEEAVAGGHLWDTGHGFPAFIPASNGEVPGMLVRLDPGAAARTLAVLDRVEGVDSGMFSRQARNTGGEIAWTYVANHLSIRGARIDSWN